MPKKKKDNSPTETKHNQTKPDTTKKIKEADQAKTQISWVKRLKQDRKLQLMVIICAGLLLMVIGIAIAVLLQPKKVKRIPEINKQRPASINTNTAEPKPTVLPRRLDGIMVAAADANRVPACVMIENAAFEGVRPQAGISAAQVVYEVIVEGGITRWMAVFSGEPTERIGPVRSARDTYLEFVSELNCAYVHAGGSPTALTSVQQFKLRDIDALREYQWFWRDSAKYAPHNLFTNYTKLIEGITNGHSWKDDSTFSMWNFVDDKEIVDGDLANEVTINFGGAYDVRYVYNSEEQYYERWNGNVLQTDATTGKTLTTRNIIIQKVPPGEIIEGKGRINFSVTGEGAAYIFRLGKLTQGVWKKAARTDRTKFFTDTGEEIALARGTSWVEIVPKTHSFEWK